MLQALVGKTRGTKQVKERYSDQVRSAVRTRTCIPRAGRARVGWVRRFTLFHDKRDPKEIGVTEAEEYVARLAVERNVAGSGRHRALGALAFLCRMVLRRDLERPRRPERGVSPAGVLPPSLLASRARLARVVVDSRLRTPYCSAVSLASVLLSSAFI